MLNPPLSLLPHELLYSIVENVSELPFKDKVLYNLSLVDRAFTQCCQKYIFRSFKVDYRRNVSKKLNTAKKILEDKPSFANEVRTVQLAASRNEWLFNDPTFTSIIQLLAKSPMPPHDLHFGGGPFISFMIKDPIFVVQWLAKSFFSQSLTILRLSQCENIPLPIFLICPRLKEVCLNQVGATDKSYDKFPDNQCSGREPPLLEVVDYCSSHSLIKQMISPPPRFNTPVVLWSNLRILTLTPHEKEGLACLQPILHAACNTLEELYLTHLYVRGSQQIPLAGLVNLSKVSRLCIFCLYAIIDKAPRFAVISDINVVLGTIPESNKVTNLGFDFKIDGQRPFRVCLDQDWAGMFNEVIRISDGSPLELELNTVISRGNLDVEYSGEDELYGYIMDKAGSLLVYPKICTHFWNPTLWNRGLVPFPRGQVRSKCRK